MRPYFQIKWKYRLKKFSDIKKIKHFYKTYPDFISITTFIKMEQFADTNNR